MQRNLWEGQEPCIGVGGDRVVPFLASLLEDAEGDVRRAARREVGRWGPLAVPHVARLTALALEGGDDGAAFAGLAAAGPHASAAVGALSAHVLESGDRDDDSGAAHALASILGPERLARDLTSRATAEHERAVRSILTLGEGICRSPWQLADGFGPLAETIAGELSSTDPIHRRDAIEIMKQVSGELHVYAPAILSGLTHRDPAVRVDAADALRELARGEGPWWAWEELGPLLAVPVARPAVLEALALGAVPCGREPAQELARIASANGGTEREPALRALAWHLEAAQDIVVPVARDAALGADDVLAVTALWGIVFLECFPDADRAAIVAAIEERGSAATRKAVQRWHDFGQELSPCASCPEAEQ